MILDRLKALHARLPADAFPAEGYKKQPVQWVLDVSADGRVLGLVPTGAKGEQPMRQTPYARRQGTKPPPFLLVDKPAYVLGLADDGTASAKAADRHAEYLTLLDEAARASGDPDVALLASALRDPDQLAVARDALRAGTWKPGDLIVPRLDGDFLHDRPAAKAFWSRRQSGDDAEDDGGAALVAACLLCGETRPIARKHPVEVRIGPNPAPLVSMNKPAFTSHGLAQSENAPMCYACARTYGEALRFLLGDPEHHLYVSGAEWLFWTRDPAPGFSVARFFSDPKAEDVASLLKAPFAGHAPALDANRFYALVVTGGWKRMVVRSWMDRPLGDVQQRLAAYFRAQAVADYTGATPPLKLLAVAGATVRDLGDLPPQTVPALLTHALTGQRLPLGLLHQALRRAAVDRDQNGRAQPVTRARAALIRLVLASNHPELMTDPALVSDHPEPAYHCGRLLAVLDQIQRRAQGKNLNATLVDRFYGSASTTPAAVFGTLVRKAQPHVAKLRTGGRDPYLDHRLGEIAARIPAFPTTLTPVEQGLFALGFYQEKYRPYEGKPDAPDTGAPDDSTDA